ncbi:glycosyltransferase [Antrihabitans sp. YC2-6]|uniref:glycosyltransferase n=1 Tax=Antrihabitans sp. YC2-6 TaxID=2799498 RepID=UPI0018F4597A|nr:glycosyltransferase [Antrihabitans sp. YC2-6]MBJ8348323.1 glycosyltransferase family 1 protein [Antrihabitans sp. YC2-6]
MSEPIVILTYGTRGDVQPCVTLGRHLRARGHEVRVVTNPRYASMVAAAGLMHFPFGLDIDGLLETVDWSTWHAGTGNGPVTKRSLELLTSALDERMAELDAACVGARAILSPTWGGVSHYGADSRGIPSAYLHVQPWEPTRAFPNIWVSSNRSLGGRLNRASHSLAAQVHWKAVREPINRWRNATRGLPPLPKKASEVLAARAPAPVLCGFSEHVVPRPHDWSENVHVTGYWHADSAGTWAPPTELAAFLDAGDPPVYVGFGSWLPGDPVDLYRIIVAALRKAGVRGIVHVGSETGDHGRFGNDMFATSFVPYDWLFSRTAAVVHHGGAGTTGLALRAGVPNVVCPFYGDQMFWAARVHALGAGPKPVPIKGLSAETLSGAIRSALSDSRIRAKAAALGAAMRRENGATLACDIVENWLAANAPKPTEVVGSEAK